MNEIEDSTTRISTLVGAAKQYSQMDRAPYQVVDVHELLDSTLVMLGRQDRPGITVVKDYDRTLPQIPAYAAELNQVWTNLIDNARRTRWTAQGTLTVRTARATTTALLVEIGDTGPGHPAGHPGPDLRAVLHHQAGRRGHRARAWTSPGGSWSTSTTATCRSSRSPATPGSGSGCR